MKNYDFAPRIASVNSRFCVLGGGGGEFDAFLIYFGVFWVFVWGEKFGIGEGEIFPEDRWN